ncbi:MAG TPA: methyltransferase, partial [Acetobacteraceae bacterium]|nr:methyltransferase [Acetobacteraceae bacterium]
MTTDADPLATHRAAYAKAVVARYGADDPAVEVAFAKVPREAFLGPSPWSCGRGGPLPWSRTSEVEALYQDVLVALDPAKG